MPKQCWPHLQRRQRPSIPVPQVTLLSRSRSSKREKKRSEPNLRRSARAPSYASSIIITSSAEEEVTLLVATTVARSRWSRLPSERCLTSSGGRLRILHLSGAITPEEEEWEGAVRPQWTSTQSKEVRLLRGYRFPHLTLQCGQEGRDSGVVSFGYAPGE